VLFRSWDLQHVSTGASFDFLQIEFTLGLQYSWGGGGSDRLATGLLGNAPVLAETLGDVEYDYQRLKILLGFNLPFGTAEGDI